MSLLDYKYKARFGSRYNLGGDSTTDASNTSTTTTTTSQVNTDNSMQIGDNGLGINGYGNTIDNQKINNTSFLDVSNKSTNFNDASNRSTNFTDNSNRSSTTSFTDQSNSNNDSHAVTTFQTTDFGSVQASLNGMASVSDKALNTSGLFVSAAMDGLKGASSQNLDAMKLAFDFVGKTSANALTSAAENMQSSVAQVKGAYDAAATAPEQKTLKTMALMLGGAAVLIYFWKH